MPLMLPSCGLSPRPFLGGIFCDYDVIICFRKDQPQSEGSRHSHHGIKSPPACDYSSLYSLLDW